MLYSIARIIRFVIMLALIVHPASGEEGGASTGGGGAFVCRDGAGQIVDAELLDLWESRERRRWDIPYTNEDVALQIETAVSKLKSVDIQFYERVVADLRYVQANVEWLPATQDINPPADAMAGYVKPGCPLEGMMLFDGETQRLSIKRERFSKLLNNTNIAAAWVHEAVYKTLREAGISYQQADSRNARKLTSCLFARNDCLGIANAPKLPTDKKIHHCVSPLRDFYAYLDRLEARPEPKEHWTLLYTKIGGSTFGTFVRQDLEFLAGAGKIASAQYYFGILKAFGFRTALDPEFRAVFLNVNPQDPQSVVFSMNETLLHATEERVPGEQVSCKLIN